MKLADGPRALVAGLALVACAFGLSACALERSGLASPDASAAGTGAGGLAGEPTGTGGATAGEGGAGGGASSSASSAASSGSGGGSPQEPCGPGSTLGFQDDFNDNLRNLTLWNAYANSLSGIFETGQQVVIYMDPSNDRGGYISYPFYSLLGCYVYIEVKQVANSYDGGSAEVYFRLNGGPGQHLEFRQRGSDLALTSVINGDVQSDPISYSPSIHRWWRLRELNGKITWDTSSNGQDWQTWRSMDTSTFSAVTALQLEFGASGGAQSDNDVHFDNVNVNAGGL